MNDIAAEWLIQAVSDLEDAKTLCDFKSYSNAIYNAEQCAEKICKGLLLYTGTEFKLKDSLIQLLEQIIGTKMVDDELLINQKNRDGIATKALWLTMQAALTRYPDDSIGVAPCKLSSKEDAEYAITCAQNFINIAIKAAPEIMPCTPVRKKK